MNKTINITKKNIETATAAIEATDKLDQTVRQSIAAYAKLGKVLKRLPDDRAAFDAALVKLKLRDAKTGKDDKRSTVQRDLWHRDNRSLCVKLYDNMPAVNRYLKQQAKTGGKVSTMSGVLTKIAAEHRKANTGSKPKNQQTDFEKLADKFYADCRKLGITSIDALAMLQNYDSEKNIEADLKMAKAS